MAEGELQTAVSELKRWLMDAALPIWASAGVNPSTGAFEEAVGFDGAASHALHRARVQARQVYVYAVADACGWPGYYREARRAAEAFICSAFRRSDGLYRTRVGRDGAPVDDTPHLYDQAFFLFSGAAVAIAEPDRAQELESQALALLSAVEGRFARAAGGFREASEDQPFQSNPHMHLFEAALAWEAVTGRERWRATADRIAELCLHRFIDAKTGALREFFDADWGPAPGVAGRIVEPGHQFEWAWLLKRWSMARRHSQAAAAARRLFHIGLEYGVDPGRGVAFNALDDSFATLDPVARLWPQTERIKAALLLAEEDPAAQVLAAIKGLQLYLDVEPLGLWRDRLKPDGGFVEEPAPASSFYHIVCMLNELFAAGFG